MEQTGQYKSQIILNNLVYIHFFRHFIFRWSDSLTCRCWLWFLYLFSSPSFSELTHLSFSIISLSVGAFRRRAAVIASACLPHFTLLSWRKPLAACGVGLLVAMTLKFHPLTTCLLYRFVFAPWNRAGEYRACADQPLLTYHKGTGGSDKTKGAPQRKRSSNSTDGFWLIIAFWAIPMLLCRSGELVRRTCLLRQHLTFFSVLIQANLTVFLTK